MTNETKSTRLESLDILRGFDLFMLVFFQPIFVTFAASFFDKDSPIGRFNEVAFHHIQWEGFYAWDLVMPLFLFMTGASIPFAFSSYKRGNVATSSMIKRIIKRVLLLWLFGAIIQGNILDLNIDTLKLYSNTLQAIAIGYLFASLIYMFCSLRGVIIATILLPIIYTTGMLIYGNYLPATNLAEVIDRAALGHFVDGATIGVNGEAIFSKWYNYAWIYPSINFTTTVLSGVLCTLLIRSKLENKKKALYILLIGIACVITAYALSPIEPIIKKIWTSTMTLLSSGYCFILMAIFYYFIDIRRKGRWLRWLNFYGMNSILAYMLANTLNLRSLVSHWFHGFEQYIGSEAYSVLFVTIEVSIVFVILRYCYKRSIFLKV